MTKDELYQKTEIIIKTLPLAYYLHVSTIDVTLSAVKSTSYFDPNGFKIVVAFNNILERYNNAKIKPTTDKEIEEYVRCFLYHEVSHAILTPKDLMYYANEYNRNKDNIDYFLDCNLANIMEDERIETILRNYYRNVNFKKNVFETLGFNSKTAPKESLSSFENFIFYAFRFRYAVARNDEVQAVVNQFISNNKRERNAGRLSNSMNENLKSLYAIYNDLINAPNQNENNTKENQEESKENQEENGDNSSTSPSKNNEEQQGSTNGSCGNESAQEGKAEEYQENIKIESGNLNKQITDVVADIINSNTCKWSLNINSFYLYNDIVAKFISIIQRNVGTGVYNGCVQNGYHGKFSPKAYMNDFEGTKKWWHKQAFDETGVNDKKSNKKVLNIWLDNSGSFKRHDDKINSILRALVEVERKVSNFEFNLIKTNNFTYLVESKKQRVSCSDGGTNFTANGIDIYKQLNKNGDEMNIVLFDGYTKGIDNLFVFNNRRSIFITEKSNTDEIKQVCPSALKIIEENNHYEGKLLENITTAMDLLF